MDGQTSTPIGARSYGFFGRWEDAALDVELLGAETSVDTMARTVAGGPLLVSVKDAAEHLGISCGVMYELIKRGEMECVRIGQRRLVSREAMNHFIERNSSAE